MNKRIKVLQIQQNCEVMAADLHEEIVKALPTSDFDVTTAYFHGSPKKTGSHSESESTHYFNFSHKELKGLRLRLMWKIWKFCRNDQYDVVITHRYKPLEVMLKLNRFLKIPVCIGVIHGIGDFDRRYRRKRLRRLNTKNWRFVGVSPAVCGYLSELEQGTIKEQVVSINNAIDYYKIEASMLSKDEARSSLGIKESAIIFGTIGRLVKIKGHMDLLKAFHKLHKEEPNTQLVIIGEGRERAALEQYIQSNNLHKPVLLAGEIINANRYIKAFDVFVLPSYTEGLPIAILEAMTGGIPIIATKVGGVQFTLEDKAQLLEPGNISTLHEAMFKYLSLPAPARKSLGDALTQRLLDHFDIQQYRNSYKELINARLASKRKGKS